MWIFQNFTDLLITMWRFTYCYDTDQTIFDLNISLQSFYAEILLHFLYILSGNF